MILIKTILDIRLKNIPDNINYHSKVFHALTGKKLEKPVIDDGFKIGIKKDRAKVVIESNRIAISSENQINTIEGKKYLVKILNQINRVLNFDEIESDRIGYRNHFILNFDNSFDEALKIFKEKFFTKNDLVANSCDVGMPINYKKDNININTMSGPMNKQQLLDIFIEFKEDFDKDINDNFFFFDSDIFTSNLLVTENKIEEFIDFGNKENDSLIKIWKSNLNS
jgi:hypothetical protein